jgi:hypothetical protein
VVSYSPRAAKALGLLKSPYNDVEIFVEDTGNHNMWLNICRALLPETVRLSSVNLLGGRDAVVAACRLDQDSDGRRKLYIIDGDFDFLLNKRKPRLKFLHRLQAYCVENLLFSENALVQIGLESRPTWTEATVSAALAFDKIVEELDNHIKPLFVLYASVFKEARRVKTVKHPVNTLYIAGENGPRFCKNKIRARAIGILLRASRLVEPSVLRARFNMVKNASATININKAVSGKDYILPFVLAKFKACCGYNGGPEQFKVALSRSFHKLSDPNLTRTLAKL